MQILHRLKWTGSAVDLGELFIMKKDQWLAICKLTSHRDGWELRLYVNSPEHTVASRVCGIERDVFTTGEAWKGKMIERGWIGR